VEQDTAFPLPPEKFMKIFPGMDRPVRVTSEPAT
jgi:hypothetical protein